MITRRRRDGQLYVYHNGQLIYKRWIAKGYGVVFDPYGPPWGVPRYVCERCGGSGRQGAGLYDPDTRRYDSRAGACRACGGEGRLGERERGSGAREVYGGQGRRDPGTPGG